MRKRVSNFLALLFVAVVSISLTHSISEWWQQRLIIQHFCEYFTEVEKVKELEAKVMSVEPEQKRFYLVLKQEAEDKVRIHSQAYLALSKKYPQLTEDLGLSVSPLTAASH